MSKGSKKKKKKSNSVNNKVINKSVKINEKMSLSEKLELFLYIGQYIIFFIGVFGVIATLILFAVSYFYSLSDNYDKIFGSLLVSIILLVNFFTFGKFKEIRNKYNKKKRGK